MKVVALVSGGKDSCYSMMLCKQYGHEVVALAHLLPESDEVDELDSYMYQTAGHALVAGLAECTGLPLFRRRIRGTARHTGLQYRATAGDEVEDLAVLLRAVQAALPGVAAVASGAIASDYQRLRVESVCARLGLVSLAPLWQRDQAELLQEMLGAGVHAIVVKVAALGLDPTRHLGQPLSALQPLLTRLADKYGCSVCGEGGEYESLTLDCPFFQCGRIILDDSTLVIPEGQGSIAPVGVLRPCRFHVERKQAGAGGNNTLAPAVVEVADVEELPPPPPPGPSEEAPPPPLALVSGFTQAASGVVCATARLHEEAGECDSGAAVRAVLSELVAVLAAAGGLGWQDVLFVHLYVADLGAWEAVNKAYVACVRSEDCPWGVPSRATVEVALGAAGLGPVAACALAAPRALSPAKRVLHVQSISAWAPACIGPYSQATSSGGLLHLAGALGLEPASMALLGGGAGVQMGQALRNCEAVARACGASVGAHALAVTVYGTCEWSSCCTALAAWRDRRAKEEEASEGEEGTALPGLWLWVGVRALPKGAAVEIAPLLHQMGLEDACRGGEGQTGAAVWKMRRAVGAGMVAHCSCSVPPADEDDGREELTACLSAADDAVTSARLSWQSVVVLRIYFVAPLVRATMGALRDVVEEAMSGLNLHQHNLMGGLVFVPVDSISWGVQAEACGRMLIEVFACEEPTDGEESS